MTLRYKKHTLNNIVGNYEVFREESNGLKSLLTMHGSQSTETSFFIFFSFLVQSVDQLRDHSFSTYEKFSKKLTDVCVSGGKKCQFFGKFCLHTT